MDNTQTTNLTSDTQLPLNKAQSNFDQGDKIFPKDPRGALVHYKTAADTFEKIQLFTDAAAAHELRIRCFCKLKQFEEIKEVVGKAGTLCRKSKNYEALATIYRNVGLSLTNAKKYDLSIEYYDKAFHLFKSHKKRAEILKHKAWGHYHVGSFDKTLSCYKEACRLHETLNDKMNIDKLDYVIKTIENSNYRAYKNTYWTLISKHLKNRDSSNAQKVFDNMPEEFRDFRY